MAAYTGKINSKASLYIIGFQGDIEIAKAIALPVLDYMEETLSDLKECYISYMDFRIFKRDWCHGFSVGIENQLKNAFIEMKKEKKFELSVIDLHPVLKTYKKKFIVNKTSHFTDTCLIGYDMGLKDGSAYNLERNQRNSCLKLE